MFQVCTSIGGLCRRQKTYHSELTTKSIWLSSRILYLKTGSRALRQQEDYLHPVICLSSEPDIGNFYQVGSATGDLAYDFGMHCVAAYAHVGCSKPPIAVSCLHKTMQLFYAIHIFEPLTLHTVLTIESVLSTRSLIS